MGIYIILMKFATIAIAAFLGYTQAGVRLTRTDGSITDLPDLSYVQTEESKIQEKDKVVTYTPSYDGYEGNKGTFGDWREPYERVLPERFDTKVDDTADTFTGKMIREYAVETSDKDT